MTGPQNPPSPTGPKPAPTGEHGTASTIEILPVTGLPEFRPGDELSVALATAAPWLRDGDVVVVTSKVVSKCEGRLVPAPEDEERRDELRRKLVDDEAVRVLARKGRTLITENRLGLVQAAAGVDGSNVGRSNWRCCPSTPTPAPRPCGPGCASGSASPSPWSSPTRWAAPGATARSTPLSARPGLAVLHNYSGAVDGHGNELMVTEIAVADEIAAAADLVKGKLTAMPVAVVRGLPTTRRRLNRPPTAAAGCRRPVLARYRRSPRPGSPAGPAVAQVGAPVQRRAGAAGAGRGRRRRGPHRAGAASHPAGAVRVAADARPPGPGCWTG